MSRQLQRWWAGQAGSPVRTRGVAKNNMGHSPHCSKTLQNLASLGAVCWSGDHLLQGKPQQFTACFWTRQEVIRQYHCLE